MTTYLSECIPLGNGVEVTITVERKAGFPYFWQAAVHSNGSLIEQDAGTVGYPREAQAKRRARRAGRRLARRWSGAASALKI